MPRGWMLEDAVTERVLVMDLELVAAVDEVVRLAAFDISIR